MSTTRTRSLALALSTMTLVSGCAWISAVDVNYPEASASPAMLASVAPRRVAVGPVGDRRGEKSRIGSKPKNGDAITTRRSVADIVRDALGVEVAKNGHTVVSETPDVILAADVEEFWLDTVPGSGPSRLYVGRVAIAVMVSDPRTGGRLFTRRYVGVKRRQVEEDSKTVWRDVMDAALARTVHDAVTDPDLVAAFGRRAPSATSSAPETNG
jgi:hypothetical protein